METETETGTAYGFFHCESSKEEIERELPALKIAGKVPNLDLILMGTPDLREEELQSFVRDATSVDLNYVLKGTNLGKTNRSVAMDVSHLLMQIDQSYLNKLGEVWGNVVYREDDGVFVFL